MITVKEVTKEGEPVRRWLAEGRCEIPGKCPGDLVRLLAHYVEVPRNLEPNAQAHALGAGLKEFLQSFCFHAHD